MTDRVEHALVMDTDDIPGRGGYAVVGLSDGVAPAERVFVATNFGISDYLHDPRNERAFYSFCRVPGGRYAFTRRFPSGRRRNETQNRLFVHTLFLSDAQFAVLEGLPWLLIESKFRVVPDEPWQSLSTDGERLVMQASRALEWDGGSEIVPEICSQLRVRADRVGKLLPGVDPVNAIATVITALQRGEPALLPQGTAYELLTLLAWSCLPLADRAVFPWTQHDSMNVGVAFETANVPAGATVDVRRTPNPVERRLVEMNLERNERRRDLHTRAARYGIRIRGDRLRLWLDWRDSLSAVQENLEEPEEKIFAALEALAKSAEASTGQPWAESQEVLQLLWPNIERAIKAGQPPELPVKRWAGLLERSGLGGKIFREKPSPEWLDRIAADVGAQLLVFFFVFSTENDPAARSTREALAEWLLQHRGEKPDRFILARLVVRLGADRSEWVEPLLGWLLDDPEGLGSLADATPLDPRYGDLVLLATLVAIGKQHGQTTTYVRSALVPHFEASEETREHVRDALVDAVAPILRDDPDMFLRFFRGQPAARQSRLLSTVRGWMTSERDATLPLARTIVERMSREAFPRSREADALVFALASAGEKSSRWGELLVRIAGSSDASWFADSLRKVDPSRIDLGGLADAVVRQLEPGSGSSIRALVSFTRPSWNASILKVLSHVLRGASDVREWESIVTAAVKMFGKKAAAEAGKLLQAFWSRVEPAQVRSLSDDFMDVTQHTSGAWRSHLRSRWTPLIRRLPPCPQSERLIAILDDTPEARIALVWRAFDLRSATIATLNGFHDDLCNGEADYEEEMGKAVDRWAGMMPARDANPVERAQRMLDLAGNAGVKFAIRQLAAERMPLVLSRLRPRDWAALVRLSVAQLARNGSAWMTFTRLLGAARDAEEAARDLETICLREKLYDGRDGIRAGRQDAKGLVRRTLERARSALGQG